jgi:anti-sigma factor (TIGR02949 family)
MNCREVVDLLNDYLDGALSAEDAAIVRAHLDACPPCVCYVATYQLTITLSRRLPAEAPPAQLLERLRAAAQENQ